MGFYKYLKQDSRIRKLEFCNQDISTWKDTEIATMSSPSLFPSENYEQD